MFVHICKCDVEKSKHTCLLVNFLLRFFNVILIVSLSLTVKLHILHNVSKEYYRTIREGIPILNV
ncbi:hypothetical protein RhiirA5_214498 [Rhizophagus irregularis]|uniref:Uncharacterized protein n=1 Tax=Rhizophagus irregularis TaxID=588596 RepID=A0A2N0PGV7_9GLOM|nr:hypothetical protein RhiirA5_214498 [Rhizophagus irregularis]